MLNLLIGPVTELLGKVIPDKTEAARLAHEIATLATKQAHEANMGQIEINKEEAKHRSIFVAGWRPFLGWGLATAMIWHFVIAPVTIFAFAYAGVTAPDLPVFDMDSLMTVLLGMLGLGGLRTAEKIRGVSK